MATAEVLSREQRTRWNGVDGAYWAQHQDQIDRMLAPVMEPLFAFAAPTSGMTVIDVGCGCGATTIELAKAVGASGHVIGLDVSEPMIELARYRLKSFDNVRFDVGDAAEVSLAGVNADLVLSRFGVMFFGDPVAAFRNLASGLKAGGKLCFACWRPMVENPRVMVPLEAAYEHVPRLPETDANEPGPFAFGDSERVKRILSDAGFQSIEVTPLDLAFDLSSGGSLDDAVVQSSELGPAKRAIANQPAEIRTAALASIRKHLEPYANESGVWLQGGIWLVGAVAGE